MGVDLTLMPLLSDAWWGSHDIWSVNRRRELWDAIDELEVHPVPGKFTGFMSSDDDGEYKYGEILADRYGEKLTYIDAGELAKLKDHEAVQDNWKNKGFWELISLMPPTYPIVLFWH